MKYISARIFLISFFIGLFFVYILGPNIKTIYVYPTPNNIDKFTLKNMYGECFKYKKNTVPCPSNGEYEVTPV
jgi:hypothetical protein